MMGSESGVDGRGPIQRVMPAVRKPGRKSAAWRAIPSARAALGGASRAANYEMPVIRKPSSMGVNTMLRSDKVTGACNSTPGEAIMA